MGGSGHDDSISAIISKKSSSHRNLMEYSKVLEGCHRHASTHAAGVVIAPGPLTDYVPLFKNPSTFKVVILRKPLIICPKGVFSFAEISTKTFIISPTSK